MHPDVAAELLVSDAVDERAEQPGQNVGEHVAGEHDLGLALGPDVDQEDVDQGREVGERAYEELDAVQGDGVAGFLGSDLV